MINPSLIKQPKNATLPSTTNHLPSTKSGFTIVELLVVIVVIGILAAITIVSYTGISQKAIVASIQSDLSGASNRLKMYYVENGQYPQGVNYTTGCPTTPVDDEYCLKSSSGNTFSNYSSTTPYQTFTLDATNTNTTKYRITNDSAPVAVTSTPTPVTYGPLSPATTADDATVGTVAWTNPNNARVSDGVYAISNGDNPASTVASPSSATGSVYNQWTNPANAYTADTIYATDVYTSGAGGIYFRLSSNAGSTWSGYDSSNGYVQFYPYNTISTKSTSSSLYGRSWVPGDFTNANFKLDINNGTYADDQDYYNFNIPTIPSNATITGVQVSLTGYSTGVTPKTQYVDQILVKVYYTTPAASTSHYLKATNFGFAIPTDATINGIKAEVENKETVSSLVADNSVKIVKGGTISGMDKASGTYWPTTEAYATYGGAADLWGNAWTAADINASNFGVAISSALSGGSVAQVDHIRITVYYTTSSGSTVPMLSSPTASGISTDNATLGATIISDGGSSISARGTCWGTSPQPTTNCLAEGGTATGVFTMNTGTVLSLNTTYYYRGYATNSNGTSYSIDGTFMTSSGGCFLPGTLISTPNGDVAIEDLHVGDEVWSIGSQGKIKNVIKETYIHHVTGYFDLETAFGNLLVTGIHPLLTTSGYKTVDDIHLGDRLITSSGSETVLSKTYIEKLVTVYNFGVDEPHNYFANGFVAHNKISGSQG